jgi:hypothetical protein
VPFLLILLAMLVLAPAPLAARQTPQTTDVTGAIIDARTGEPIAGAVVRFPRANRYTLTSDDGTFILRNVPLGVHEVFIHRIGYQEHGYRFTVTPGRHTCSSSSPPPSSSTASRSWSERSPPTRSWNAPRAVAPWEVREAPRTSGRRGIGMPSRKPDSTIPWGSSRRGPPAS